MAEEVKSFGDLKSTLIKAQTEETKPEAGETAQPNRDAQGRAYATGKRKDAVARVWIKPGRGKITVNGREEKIYFARPVLRMILRQPLIAANRDGQFDVIVTDRLNERESRIDGVRLPMPGEHNVQNALAAIVVARELGVNFRATSGPVIARAGGRGGHRQAAGFATEMSEADLVAFLREQVAAQL